MERKSDQHVGLIMDGLVLDSIWSNHSDATSVNSMDDMASEFDECSSTWYNRKYRFTSVINDRNLL